MEESVAVIGGTRIEIRILDQMCQNSTIISTKNVRESRSILEYVASYNDVIIMINNYMKCSFSVTKNLTQIGSYTLKSTKNLCHLSVLCIDKIITSRSTKVSLLK